ncbi:MAG: cytidylate kinase family protein [Patescibacteria group bacterium]|jgi:cytidylate kinase
MVITIAGLPGSGKTTIAKMISEYYKIPWYSMGDLRGRMAIDRGMMLDEFNKLGETEAFTDKEVDDYQTKLGQSGESFVIDSRLSWHFIPNAYKIFLDVDPSVAAERIMGASRADRQDEKPYASVEEAKAALAERVASDERRYQKYYNLDILDLSPYDLVVDTSHKTPEGIMAEIKEKVDAWHKS